MWETLLFLNSSTRDTGPIRPVLFFFPYSSSHHTWPCGDLSYPFQCPGSSTSVQPVHHDSCSFCRCILDAFAKRDKLYVLLLLHHLEIPMVVIVWSFKINIKSIKYLESSNYRYLLDFIESDTYQIFIMGHSCGNSDRTLLNTLFEHRNCASIKPFYFIRKDGTDNYMELIQNISRNFTDMKLMRDRVVNKTFCEPYSDLSNRMAHK